MKQAIRYLALFLVAISAATAQEDSGQSTLRESKLGETRNVHSFGKNLLCGQPSPEELASAGKRGINVVITLREEAEVDWDESAVARDAGMEFHAIRFSSPESLTDSVFERCLRILAQSDESPVMLHCASANRVGAIWMAHRAITDKIPVEEALKEAKEVGLRSPALEAKAKSYVKKHLSKK